MRVLYVEDNPADQQLTQRHLARHAPKLKLHIVPTVADAITALAAGDVDLVLSDYRLPDGTGLELVEAIRARDWLVPVVLVTASGDTDTAVRLLKAGAADYIVKRGDYLDSLPAVLDGAFRWFDSLRELRHGVVRVLYVEHDAADVEMTRRAFREHGSTLDLDVVSTTREALHRLRTTPYDLLLLDYRMPDASGIEVLKTLRTERIQIPVVMLTGQGDEDTAVQAFKLGAADYIIKREGYLAKLPSTVENVLARRRLADEKDALLILNGLTTSIAALRDVDELARQVSRTAADVLRAEMAVLWLRSGSELRPVGWIGLEAPAADALALAIDEAALVAAAAERRVVLAAIGLRPADGSPASTSLADADRTLAVSLLGESGIMGVLAVTARAPRRFGGTDERLLTILADHAAAAIANLRLYQELSQRVDELRRAQTQLVQTEKLAAMGQLLAGVAHELNNPLSVVLGQAVLLGHDIADPRLAARAGKITQAAERCARIVRNFLALARQQPPSRSAVDLNQVVREALELLAYPLRVDGIDVQVDLAEDLPPLRADPHQLHQVVVNLVSNAQQALAGGAPPRFIRLTSRYDAGTRRAVLDVSDSGPGVPPEIRTRIFEPFFTTKPPGQGTGLGLSLCHGIVDAHGGTIRVESREGTGATFRIELPVDPGAQRPAAAVAPVPARPNRAASVLVVDDEPEVATTLADMLTLAGFRVDTASNGRVALDRLQERTYDLVFSDLKMPELDGPGLYRELERRDPRLLRRLVFLTGDALSAHLVEFLRVTGAVSLQKPFSLESVRELTRRLLA